MLFGRKKESNKSFIQLENEYRQLQLNLMTITDQLENFKQVAFKYQNEYMMLVRAVKNLCMLILDQEYAKDQLGGNSQIKDMNIYALMEYTQKVHRENKAKDREMLMNLTKGLQQKELEIEGLKAQISRYLIREKQKEEYGDEIMDTPVQEETPVVSVPANPAPYKQEKKEPDKKSEAKLSPVHENPKGIMRMIILEDEDEEDEEGVKETPMTEAPETSKAEPAKPVVGKEQEKANPDQPAASMEEKLIQQVRQYKQKKDDIVAHVVDLNDYMKEMNEVMWAIVLAIGKDGLSESKDLKKSVINGNVTVAAFNSALTKLRSMKIIDEERIVTGWRWFNAYELSSTGRRIYLEKFKENPVECEKQKLKKEHTTALHGYCIKDVASILKAVFGYDEVSTDRKANTIKLPSGEVYIPDVIAKKKQGAVVDYFEVELGHHTQKDFNEKCDKMRAVTKDMYFITPDADTMNNKLAKQIGQWVLDKGGKDKLKGTTIYLTTLTKLNEGKYENIYPF